MTARRSSRDGHFSQFRFPFLSSGIYPLSDPLSTDATFTHSHEFCICIASYTTLFAIPRLISRVEFRMSASALSPIRSPQSSRAENVSTAATACFVDRESVALHARRTRPLAFGPRRLDRSARAAWPRTSHQALVDPQELPDSVSASPQSLVPCPAS